MKPIDDEKEAVFHLFNEQTVKDKTLTVHPTAQTLPVWYRNAKKFFENGHTPTFKSCISFFDAMSFGYSFVLPTDITIKEVDGNPVLEMDPDYSQMFTKREAMDNFVTPVGCYDVHYAYTPVWGVQLPDGYSAIYTQPMNRFELPFVLTSGVIENDVYFSPGQIPFFIRKDAQGVVPKGTPIAQVIPFKRDGWVSRENVLSQQMSYQIDTIDKQDLRSKKSGGYRDKYWVSKVAK